MIRTSFHIIPYHVFNITWSILGACDNFDSGGYVTLLTYVAVCFTNRDRQILLEKQ